MFILSVSYKKPFAEVKANPDAHRAYPGKHCAQGKFVFSGRRNSRTGDVFFAARKNEAEVRQVMQEDPFYYKGIADYEIVSITSTKYTPGFEKFL